MEMLGKIQRLHLRDKKSLHEIAKSTGLSRNTILGWLRTPDEAAAPVYRRNELPGKLTAFHEALEQALRADSHRTKQNRRTAKALLAQIKLGGYTGGKGLIVNARLCRHMRALPVRLGLHVVVDATPGDATQGYERAGTRPSGTGSST